MILHKRFITFKRVVMYALILILLVAIPLIYSNEFAFSQNTTGNTTIEDLSENISLWLSELTAKQSEVVARRFGLKGYDVSTLEDVGREIGLTRERVRQIQVEALRRLRIILDKQGISVDSLFR